MQRDNAKYNNENKFILKIIFPLYIFIECVFIHSQFFFRNKRRTKSAYIQTQKIFFCEGGKKKFTWKNNNKFLVTHYDLFIEWILKFLRFPVNCATVFAWWHHENFLWCLFVCLMYVVFLVIHHTSQFSTFFLLFWRNQ